MVNTLTAEERTLGLEYFILRDLRRSVVPQNSWDEGETYQSVAGRNEIRSIIAGMEKDGKIRKTGAYFGDHPYYRITQEGINRLEELSGEYEFNVITTIQVLKK